MLLLLSSSISAQTLDRLVDVRVGTAVVRGANGAHKRSATVLAAFQRIHPCPSTGEKTGACPNWAIDHTIPLACGGVDAVYNLAWIPDVAKSCKEWWCKDRYERKIYASDPEIPDTPSCHNVVIK